MDETTYSNVTFYWDDTVKDYPKPKQKPKKYVEPVNEHTFSYDELEGEYGN